MPTFSPRNRPKVAPEKSSRGPRRMATSEKLSMEGRQRAAAVVNGRAEARGRSARQACGMYRWTRTRFARDRQGYVRTILRRPARRWAHAPRLGASCTPHYVASADCASHRGRAEALWRYGPVAGGAGMGPDTGVAGARKSLIPTVNIAPAEGWPRGRTAHGRAAASRSNAFATQLEHPRWLYVLPNGDVLVAETNAPPKPEDGKGIKGRVMKEAMKKRGRGRAERESHHASARCGWRRRRRDAHRVLHGSEFAVRHGTRRQRLLRRRTRMPCVRFPYTDGATQISSPARKSWSCRRARSITTGPRT